MDRRILVSSARIHMEYAYWELRILLCAYFGASWMEDSREERNSFICVNTVNVVQRGRLSFTLTMPPQIVLFLVTGPLLLPFLQLLHPS